jgi:hypothetical protein
MVGGRGKIKEDIWNLAPSQASPRRKPGYSHSFLCRWIPACAGMTVAPCRSLAVQLAFFTV